MWLLVHGWYVTLPTTFAHEDLPLAGPSWQPHQLLVASTVVAPVFTTPLTCASRSFSRMYEYAASAVLTRTAVSVASMSLAMTRKLDGPDSSASSLWNCVGCTGASEMPAVLPVAPAMFL